MQIFSSAIAASYHTGGCAEQRGSILHVGTARSLFWTYFGYVCELFAGALLVAYVVRHIPLRDYGAFLLAQSLAASLYLLDFGLASVLVQLFVSSNERSGKVGVSRLASTLVFSLLGIGLVGVVALTGLAHVVPRIMHLSPQASLVLLLIPLSGIAVAIGLPAPAIEDMCQAFHRFDVVNQSKIAALLLRVVLTILVLHRGHGVVALAVVQIAAAFMRLFAVSVAAQWAVEGFSWAHVGFDVAMLREAFAMSSWAFGDDVARRIGNNIETLILASFGGFAQVAVFGVGTRLPAHLYAFAAQGLKVALPSFSLDYIRHDTASSRESYVAIFRLCTTAMIPSLLFLVVTARPLIEVWAGQAYVAATGVLVWQLAFCLSQVLEIPSDLVLYSNGQIPMAARFSLVETLLKIVLAFTFVFRWGAVGVAAAVALSHWAVNLIFYLPAACRSIGLRVGELMAHAFRSTNKMWIAILAGGAVLGLMTRYKASPQSFAACLIITVAYGIGWLKFSALPLGKISRDASSEGGELTNMPHPYPQTEEEL